MGVLLVAALREGCPKSNLGSISILYLAHPSLLIKNMKYKTLQNLILERKESKDDNLIHRDTFLYLNPTVNDHTFAQCQTCIHWNRITETCEFFDKNIQVKGTDSCGFYFFGLPKNNLTIKNPIDPKEAGLVRRQVRCENCMYFKNGKICGLFQALNKKMPDYFKLETTVDPQGCCNAQTPKKK